MLPKADREERRLQRQRGAGKRKVKNTAGFDLDLPSQEVDLFRPRRSHRSRKTLNPETLLPQYSSGRTPSPEVLLPQGLIYQRPAPDATILSRPSARKPFPPDPHLPPKVSTRQTPVPKTTGKRKRPTGEATFDVPDSPLLPEDSNSGINRENEQRSKKLRANEEGDDDTVDARDAEVEVEPGSVLEPMEVNGGALQKSTVKKRKKRKSIGQQAPRRAKAKASPAQKQAAKEVKPEPLSSPAQGEGTSRLLEIPPEDENPAEVQIRQELAGAAEEGLRDSLIEDTETEAPKKTQLSKRRPMDRRPAKMEKIMASESLFGGGELGTDSQIYSLPMSTPIVTRTGALKDAEEGLEGDGGEGEQDAEGEADEEGEAEDKGRLAPRAPTAKMFPSPAKSKRKKRKSIGQQKPKRPATGATSKPPLTVKEPAPSNSLKQQKPKLKPLPSASTRKPQQAPSKSIAASKSRRPPANTVPITIYRPSSQNDAAETGNEISDPDHDDPLIAPLPQPPNTLNAIDVLAQVTRELVAKTASNPKLSCRSQKTMQLYGQELEARMEQLRQALATNAALGQRVKTVSAEEKRIRREVGEVKSEREGVRERIEEVKGLKREMGLGILLGGIADWVKRGWVREEAALRR